MARIRSCLALVAVVAALAVAPCSGKVDLSQDLEQICSSITFDAFNYCYKTEKSFEMRLQDYIIGPLNPDFGITNFTVTVSNAMDTHIFLSNIIFMRINKTSPVQPSVRVDLSATQVNITNAYFDFDTQNADVLIQSGSLEQNGLSIVNSQFKSAANIELSNTAGGIFLQQSFLVARNIYVFSEKNIALTQQTQVYSPVNRCKSYCSCGVNQNYTCDDQVRLQRFQSLYEFFSNSTQKINTSAVLQKYMKKSMIQVLRYDFNANFTNVIVSNQLLEVRDSVINGSNIGIYAINLTLHDGSQVSSNGLGCTSGTGLGCGFMDENIYLRWSCGGTGGSHGGLGGYSTSTYANLNQICQSIQPRVIYDNLYYPMLEGSGGGAVYKNVNQNIQGNGGGIIYIENYNWTQNDGTISSDGSMPIQQYYNSYGSGSGGSIQLYSQFLNGTGKVSSKGGDIVKSSQGGVGAGGRIKLHFYRW